MMVSVAAYRARGQPLWLTIRIVSHLCKHKHAKNV